MAARKKDRSSVSDNARTSVSSGVASLFEVTKEDVENVSRLDGSGALFREFVARLCMASLANRGIPTTRVTWGGAQCEPDGGIDVRVKLEDSDELPRWIPRRSVGFQVKATEMLPSKIKEEMRPSVELKTSIKTLVNEGGAYIIAARDTVADKGLGGRKGAMLEAVEDEEGATAACLDYYDARRLADWANELPAVVAWVHQTLPGRSLSGWKPYGQWSWQGRGVADVQRNTEEVSEGGSREQRNGAPYLPDDKGRFIANRGKGESLTLLEGLNCVRDVLRKPGTSVRLVGMSGVGKTRFVQALFEKVQQAGDSSVALQGEGQENEGDAGKALPQEWALYTDTASAPNPPPQALLSDLLRGNLKAVLIVDNCPSSLHAELTKLLNEHPNAQDRISLLTIEYDIREDQPLETEVFRLEGGSDALIEGIIKQQFPEIPDINVGVIARFSGGNARIAIALAETVGKMARLSGLSDAELFDRLFWQRNQPDPNLMNAAQACALVYSFDGEDVDDELARLAVIADMSVLSLYRQVSELQKRGLVQQRGNWRSVLPQAIADTLAARALGSIPIKMIEQQMFLPGGERLLRSFSRRIGYLHESARAQKLVRDWLSPAGWLGDLDAIFRQGSYTRSVLHVEALANVAPVDPEGVLDVIERGVRESHGSNGADTEVPEECIHQLIYLLRSIAYEAEFFDRCLNVLIRFARIAPADVHHGAPQQSLGTEVMTSLFWMYLSGTHAKTQQRVDWLRRALQSTDDSVWRVAVRCLTAALETRDFMSWYGFECGARVRDFGWKPGREEVKDWRECFILLAKDIGGSDSLSAGAVRTLFALRFRALWRTGVEDKLEEAAEALFLKGWEKGWIAIRETLDFDGDKLPEESRRRLERLEVAGRPKDLVSRIRASVLRHRHLRREDDTDEIFGGKSQGEYVRDLGVEAATEREHFQTIADLVTSITDSGYQRFFGEGLAAGTDDLRALWTLLVAAFERHPEGQRNITVLVGYLSGVFKRDQCVFNDLLDEAILRPSLQRRVPVLQCSAPLDEQGFARLLNLLNDQSVPVHDYIQLSCGRATWALTDEQLAQIIDKLCTRGEKGAQIALDVLSMHCLENDRFPGSELREVATHLMEIYVSERWFDHNSLFDFEQLVHYFLGGNEQAARASAYRVIAGVRRKLDRALRIGSDFKDIIRIVFESQPEFALDILVGDEADESAVERRGRFESDGERSVLQHVSVEAILSWCRAAQADTAASENRWTHVAPLIPAFRREPEGATEYQWTEHARRLLEEAPEAVRGNVARVLVSRVVQHPADGWFGPLADIWKRRLPLFDQLTSMLGPSYADDVQRWRESVQEQIQQEEKRENRRREEMQRAQNSRFE